VIANNFPTQWWKCRAFLADIYRRKYAEAESDSENGVRRSMPEGMYYYLYELWQDGRMAEREEVLAGPLDPETIRARPARAGMVHVIEG
jgi:hypothetical protein